MFLQQLLHSNVTLDTMRKKLLILVFTLDSMNLLDLYYIYPICLDYVNYIEDYAVTP